MAVTKFYFLLFTFYFLLFTFYFLQYATKRAAKMAFTNVFVFFLIYSYFFYLSH